MAVGTRFIINFPRRSRPRGLGYAQSGSMLSGMGTWVVDTEYGLGPRFREGFNRPYPPEAMPTRYPRAQAARVLGPSAAVNVVARPYAATRLATTRMPVRMAPVTAPGAALFNPGVAGFGQFVETDISRRRAKAGEMGKFGAMMMALRAPGNLMPIAGGLLLGITGRIVVGPGPVRTAISLASLGAVGYGAWRVYSTADDIQKEMATTGAAAVGERVAAGATENAKAVIEQGEAASDVDKRNTLKHYSCYENARRDYENEEGLLNKTVGGTWFGNLFGIAPPARDPMGDCALTPQRLAIIKAGFAKISRADRARLDSTFAPGGALEDLGPAGA